MVSLEERYVECFGGQFKKDYLDSIDVIRNYVNKCSDTFSITTHELEVDDLIKKMRDVNYLSDKSFLFIPNGIEILISLEDFWEDIKNYIPKSVIRLELPSKFIENDTAFFNNFPYLDTLVISDYGKFAPETIKAIVESTSIKTIYYSGTTIGMEKYAESDNFYVLGSPYYYCLYDDVLYRNVEEPDISKILKGYFTPLTKIYGYDLDISSIERLYSLVDDRIKDEVIIESYKCACKYTIKLDKVSNSYQIKVESSNVLDIVKIANYMFNKGISISKILWKMKSTNYYDIDIVSLDSVAQKTEIFINYGDNLDASYEDFKGLQESVRWYRKVITDSDLSSTEKIMFAFDILKTFHYNESSTDKDDSRYAHRIIATGNIVCVGYSNLLMQILNYLDDNVAASEFGLSCYDKNKKYLGGHSRNLVKIDDDKYNIHGIFALDATWDSDKSHKITSDFASDYTSLDLYRYFLIPACDYMKTFPGDTLPHLFSCYLGNNFDKFMMKEEYKKLFGEKYEGNFFVNVPSNGNDESMNSLDVSFNDNKKTLDDSSKKNTDVILKRYLSTKRPSLEQFTEMLVNVRIAEGYSRENANKEVEKVVRINKKSIENMKSFGGEIEFFREEKGVSK